MLNTLPTAQFCREANSGIVGAIRPTTPADADILFAIWRSSVDATHDFVTSDDLLAIEVDVRAYLPSAPLLLALGELGEPLAFMGLSRNCVDALFVAGEQRGKTVGRTLMEFAKSRYSWLTTIVNEQNAQAVGFYEHLGFRCEGRSLRDSEGRAYPVLHMRWQAETFEL